MRSVFIALAGVAAIVGPALGDCPCDPVAAFGPPQGKNSEWLATNVCGSADLDSVKQCIAANKENANCTDTFSEGPPWDELTKACAAGAQCIECAGPIFDNIDNATFDDLCTSFGSYLTCSKDKECTEVDDLIKSQFSNGIEGTVEQTKNSACCAACSTTINSTLGQYGEIFNNPNMEELSPTDPDFSESFTASNNAIDAVCAPEVKECLATCDASGLPFGEDGESGTVPDLDYCEDKCKICDEIVQVIEDPTELFDGFPSGTTPGRLLQDGNMTLNPALFIPMLCQAAQDCASNLGCTVTSDQCGSLGAGSNDGISTPVTMFLSLLLALLVFFN